MSGWTLGILGGSGLYDLPGLEGGRWETVVTPWGVPSDQVFKARLGPVDLVFLPRHGRGHAIPPGEINYRANIDALKRLGVTDVVSLSACGSFREDMPPGTFVVVDQYVDRTIARPRSFFGAGCVAHVGFGEPTCRRLSAFAARAARAAGAQVVEGGTYLCIEGPQFSTRAESLHHKAQGFDVVGMTNLPEARLAREAELPYASVAMVTDYDAWHETIAPVDVASLLHHLRANAARAKETVRHLALALSEVARKPSPQGIETGLDFAIITAPEARDPALVAKLDAVAGRVLRST